MAEKRVSLYLGPLLLALVIGMLAGLGAVVFRELLELGRTLLWPEGRNFVEQFQGAELWRKILVPTCMGLLMGPVITFWAPEVRGPGVPEVMEALAIRQGRIRHRVTAIKAIVTACLISAGGSLGREGPIVQIGSSIGSSLSQLFKLGTDAKRLAIACGAAAGIAATFQAPMAGTLFAVEVLLFDLEVTSLSHIAVAAITGTMTARLFFQDARVFNVPDFFLGHAYELLIYFGLGILAGLLALVFMGTIFTLPHFWKRLSVPDWLTPAGGGFLVGIAGLSMPWALGVGYESINEALGNNFTLSFVVLLVLVKIFTTGVSIGSGMSGGIFAPSLALGAMLGSAVGQGVLLLWPGADINPAHYALVGMGAVVSGATLAPITAVLIIFELTYTYDVILPLMVASIASVLVVRLLHGYSIYETKLLQKGIDIVKGHEVNILRGLPVWNHMTKDVQVIRTDTHCSEIITLMEESHFPHFVVLDQENRLAGVLTLRDFRHIFAHHELCRLETFAEALMKREVVTVGENDNLEKSFHLFAEHNFSFLPVVSEHDPKKVVGQIKKTDLLAAYEQYVFKKHTLAPLGWVCPLPQRKTDKS